MSTQHPDRDRPSHPPDAPPASFVQQPPAAAPPLPAPPAPPTPGIPAWRPPAAREPPTQPPTPKPEAKPHPIVVVRASSPAPPAAAKSVPASAKSGEITANDPTANGKNAEQRSVLQTLKERFFYNSPPWLVSLLTHAVVLLILAFITVPSVQRQILELTASYSETPGNQLEVFDLSSGNDQQLDPDQAIGETPVSDPLAAPPMAELDASGFDLASDLQVPTIGSLLKGREAGNKQALLTAYGGTAGTETAVANALEWLKRNQQRDGTWKLNGPYADPGVDENRTAATAMAMLAFLGAGHTHIHEGPYKSLVLKGKTALLKMQDDQGNFFINGPNHHRLYSQAMATIVVCELYGMTQDAELRESAQRAINYCAAIQTPEGGWRYDPKVDSDTSVTGWFAMALQSGRMAGLDVPSFTLDGIGRYLDSAQVDDGSQYAYQPGQNARLSMTAEALLCRQYLGWQRDDPRMHRGVALILENPISWESGRANVYYWYYATQTLHHYGGQQWFQWNKIMRDMLPQQQVTSGRERGSWSPTGDAHDSQGGRLYVTCLCTFMLEVYYRHLPLYGPGK